MAKRKGSSASGPRGRKKAAREGSDTKNSESGGAVDECNQVRCEVRALEGERAKLSEKQRKLEDQKRKVEEQERRLEERKRKLEDQKRKLQVQRLKLDEQKRKLEMQLQPLRREVNQVQQNLPLKRACLADLCNVREAENAQRLDRLLPEVWEKILDELKEDDHFPLALSCRFFRQKQKELVARTRQNGPNSGKARLALKTNLNRKFEDDQPASVEYLRFCSKENVPFNEKAESQIRCLAAFHGNLPLLQELLESPRKLDFFDELLLQERMAAITRYAGEYFSPQCLLLRFGF